MSVKLYRNKKMPMVVVAKVDVQSHIMVQPGKFTPTLHFQINK